jgi:predicted dienelactone hydrolase
MKLQFSAFFCIAFYAVNALAQVDSTRLLAPSGQYGVGSQIQEYTDASRQNRIVPVQIWYPAPKTRSETLAPYSNAADYAHVKVSNQPNANFAPKTRRCPLVLICPGRGIEKFAYSTLASELASHGYIVASIDMPEIGYVIYQNGTIVKPNPGFRPSRELMMGDYAKVDEFFEPAANLGKADVGFVLNQLKNEWKDKIDFKRIALFGHSLGGRVAGAVAAADPNIKAFISMEGIPPRQIRFEGMGVPMALLFSSGQPDAAMVNYRSVIEGRQSDVYLLELAGFGHNSLTDFPLITPSQFKYQINPQIGLEIGRKIVLDYFNKYLKQKTKEFQYEKMEAYWGKTANK